MGLIPDETIQEIIAATDIVELIGSYFPLKRAGSNYRALCPFHQEKTPSFNVNPARNTYHCFGCGAGGGALRFVQEHEGVDFPTAVRKLAERAGIVIPEENFDPEAERRGRLRNRLLALHKDAAAWFHHLLFKHEIAAPARAYLKGRCVAMETAREWQLGYAPESGDLLKNWAREMEYPEDLLVEGGLLSPRDENNPARGNYSRFRDRLMFPIANDYGDIIAFSGRLLDPDVKAAKYTNSPETLLFNKSKTIYGLDKTKREILREGRAVVCEGQLDLIACHTHGIKNVVAPLGTAFTEAHARVLKRFTEELILCFDSDPAGLKAAERTFTELAKADLVARVVTMPPGEDPDSLITSRGADAFRTLLDDARDFLDFQIDHKSSTLDLESLRDRVRFAHEIASTVALINDRILQDAAIQKVASRLGIPAQEFREYVAREVREHKRHGGRVRRGEQRRAGVEAPSPESGPLEVNNPAVSLLCQLLLTSAEARAWVLENDSPEILKDIADSDVLSKVWNADIRVDDSSSVGAFLTGLSPAEETFLSGLIHQPAPGGGAGTARDCLRSLKRRGIENKLREKISQLKRPNLSTDDIHRLQKEVLDLKSSLNDIAPFVPESG